MSEAGWDHILTVEALVRGHCLVDGNKRVGWIAFTTILARLGISFRASVDDGERLCLDVLGQSLERNGVAEWLIPRMHEL
ncbi:MAG: hypothetical protein V3V08_16955 [Nannocystaceae bacterium]